MYFIRLALVALSILSVVTCAAHNPRVVKLTPPVISHETISEKIICERPKREGFFKISLEQKPPKTIIHCYGHGSIGWTTLFGSVNKAIELFVQTNPSKEAPLRIIGSGCMGLTSAIELKQRGYNVVGITTKSLYDMPSWKAGGNFAFGTSKYSAAEQHYLNGIILDTFLTYQKIDQGNHSYISEDAVTFMPVYCSNDTEAGVEYLESIGVLPEKEDVTLDFSNNVIRPGFIKHMSYFMDVTALMCQLMQEVKRLEIPLEVKEVHSFDEVAEPIIFNCSGFGAKKLNHDNSVIAVRGHLVTLNENAGTGYTDYMIYSKVKQQGHDAYIYLFPKSVSVTAEHPEGTPCNGILGGTFMPGINELDAIEQRKVDEREFELLLNRHYEFFYGAEHINNKNIKTEL
jgi:hypothetical protein